MLLVLFGVLRRLHLRKEKIMIGMPGIPELAIAAFCLVWGFVIGHMKGERYSQKRYGEYVERKMNDK